MVLRVGYVREHFSSPLLQYAKKDNGATFTLVECASGTGQMISRLTDNEIDVAIALTDPLITGIAKGSKAYKLVGSYVKSPLNWAVVTGTKSQYKEISDLRETKIGISRFGSGSYTMAYVMALQSGWRTEKLKFQVNNDIRGLIDSVNDGSTSAFMWDWYTTKPFADAGEVRFIGSVHTPWPAWTIAANPERAEDEALRKFLKELTPHVERFDRKESRTGSNIEFIKDNFGYPETDIKAWQETVSYVADCQEISTKVISDTLSYLEKAGVINAPTGGFQVTDFVNADVAKLA